MTPAVFVAVAVAGGLGACLRLLVEDMTGRRRPSEIPWGMMAVNLSGSGALGFLTGLGVGIAGPDDGALVSVLGIGLLGGYTTFGSASVTTARLLTQGRMAAGLIAGPGMLLLGIALAAIGWWGAAWLT